jgi:hypothetical protein
MVNIQQRGFARKNTNRLGKRGNDIILQNYGMLAEVVSFVQWTSDASIIYLDSLEVYILLILYLKKSNKVKENMYNHWTIRLNLQIVLIYTVYF